VSNTLDLSSSPLWDDAFRKEGAHRSPGIADAAVDALLGFVQGWSTVSSMHPTAQTSTQAGSLIPMPGCAMI